jgi:hypothetical protein
MENNRKAAVRHLLPHQGKMSVCLCSLPVPSQHDLLHIGQLPHYTPRARV